MNIEKFIKILQDIEGTNLFNPYTDICPKNDKSKGNTIRTDNLRKYLHATLNADVLLIGEAPGYLGCRRTGLPFTDERHLPIASRILKTNFEVATIGGKDKEISALHVWTVLKELNKQPMVWNIIPMHPHKTKEILSNRTPTKNDYQECTPAIQYLMANRQFNKIYAIGRQAEKTLQEMGYAVDYVRHPSHGGSNIFKNKIMGAMINEIHTSD